MNVPRASGDEGFNGHSEAGIHIQLLHVPDCPLVEELRGRLDRCLSRRGLNVIVEELEGPYTSPTLLINGTDVTGRPVAVGPSCRLDSPTEDEILGALTRAECSAKPPDSGAEDDQCA
jgi:hypothetical protein